MLTQSIEFSLRQAFVNVRYGSVFSEISAHHSPLQMACMHQRFQNEQVVSTTVTLFYCSQDPSFLKTYAGNFVIPSGVLIHVTSGTRRNAVCFGVR